MRRVPGLQRLLRGLIYLARESDGADVRRGAPAGRAGPPAGAGLDPRAIADPVLREKVRPRFALGCKRVLISSDWYPALARDDVELVTEPISHLTAGAVVTADGTARPADVVVVATGFAATEQPIARLITGAAGWTLAEAWAERGMQGYKGATVRGFPNLFLIVGPNTGLGHSSMIYMIESQVAYLVDAWRRMRRDGLAAVEVDPRRRAGLEHRPAAADAAHGLEHRMPELVPRRRRPQRGAVATDQLRLPPAHRALRPVGVPDL